MSIINREYLSYKHEMGIKSRIAIRWSNFGDIIKRFIRKENPLDIIKAQIICDIHRRELRKGYIDPAWYE